MNFKVCSIISKAENIFDVSFIFQMICYLLVIYPEHVLGAVKPTIIYTGIQSNEKRQGI